MYIDEKLTYVNERGEKAEFSVSSPFFISDATGIDGLENNIYSSQGMGQDGSTYVASSLKERNVVVTGTLRGNKRQARTDLLHILNPKLSGQLIYESKYVKRFLDVRIEKAPVLTSALMPKFQISFLANNPYWRDTEIKQEIALWKGNFHFPLCIPKEKGIIMGHREPSLIVNVKNNGDVETGMRIVFKATGTLTNPSLFNVNTREFIKLKTTMQSGQEITINTNVNHKKIISELDGVESYLLDPVDLESTFLQLKVGDNLFRYNADSNLDNLSVDVYYYENYLGV